MVEVFRTNVKDPAVAKSIAAQIALVNGIDFVNFDLGDCDRILRVVFSQEVLCMDRIIGIVSAFGFYAEVLEDVPCPNSRFPDRPDDNTTICLCADR